MIMDEDILPGCLFWTGIVVGVIAMLVFAWIFHDSVKTTASPPNQAEAPEPQSKRFSESERYQNGIYFMRDEKTGAEYLVNPSGGFIKLEGKHGEP